MEMREFGGYAEWKMIVRVCIAKVQGRVSVTDVGAELHSGIGEPSPLRTRFQPTTHTFFGMNKLGPCFWRLAGGAFGLGLGFDCAGPGPELFASVGGSSARRF